jgi:hypothetical protein
LWLGALPAPEQERPSIKGIVTQETFIRAYIPVLSKH